MYGLWRCGDHGRHVQALCNGTIESQGQKLLPSNVWPNCQLPGAASMERASAPSLVMALKESACPFMLLLPVNCHIDPQLRDMGSHGVLEPLMYICCTSPAPATLVTSTRTNQGFPLMVKRIPPNLMQGTLHMARHTCQCKNSYALKPVTHVVKELRML